MIQEIASTIQNLHHSHDVYSKSEVKKILQELLEKAQAAEPVHKQPYYNIEEIEVAFQSLHMSDYMRLQKNVVVIDYDEAFKQMKSNLEDEG